MWLIWWVSCVTADLEPPPPPAPASPSTPAPEPTTGDVRVFWARALCTRDELGPIMVQMGQSSDAFPCGDSEGRLTVEAGTHDLMAKAQDEIGTPFFDTVTEVEVRPNQLTQVEVDFRPDCTEAEYNDVLYDCTELDRCTEQDFAYRLACCHCDPVYCNPDTGC